MCRKRRYCITDPLVLGRCAFEAARIGPHTAAVGSCGWPARSKADLNTMNWVVDEVLLRGWVRNAAGDKLPVVGAVNVDEAHVLGNLVLENQSQRGIETGIARGISTLALTQAFAYTGGRLIGFDPCQDSEHGDSALKTLKEFSLDQVFELRREPAQTGIAKLDSELPVDFVFIDDVHNFQHRLVTFYLADQLLKPGGIMAFHDLWLPSMKKLLRFIQTMGSYELIPTPGAQPISSIKIRRLIGAFAKGKSYWYWWPNHFSNLLVLRKISEFDGDFLWFRNF